MKKEASTETRLTNLRTAAPSATTSWPNRRAEPASGRISVERIRTSVDFPEPLRPRMETHSPRPISKLTSSSAGAWRRLRPLPPRLKSLNRLWTSTADMRCSWNSVVDTGGTPEENGRRAGSQVSTTTQHRFRTLAGAEPGNPADIRGMSDWDDRSPATPALKLTIAAVVCVCVGALAFTWYTYQHQHTLVAQERDARVAQVAALQKRGRRAARQGLLHGRAHPGAADEAGQPRAARQARAQERLHDLLRRRPRQRLRGLERRQLQLRDHGPARGRAQPRRLRAVAACGRRLVAGRDPGHGREERPRRHPPRRPSGRRRAPLADAAPHAARGRRRAAPRRQPLRALGHGHDGHRQPRDEEADPDRRGGEPRQLGWARPRRERPRRSASSSRASSAAACRSPCRSRASASSSEAVSYVAGARTMSFSHDHHSPSTVGGLSGSSAERRTKRRTSEGLTANTTSESR